MRLASPIVLVLTGLGVFPCGAPAQGPSRGGWPDRRWTYIYEGRLADGGPDGLGIAGAPGAFDDLDGSWDHDNPGAGAAAPPWEGDLISAADATGNPGGAEVMAREGLGDNESGAAGVPDAETLAIFDLNLSSLAGTNRRIYMVTRRDVFAGVEGLLGPGGIYFGVAEDGDDSWDPANQRQPPAAAELVDVRVAYILGGPNDENRPFQGSGDSRVIDQLKARGARVTVLDDGAAGHQAYRSTDPGYAGAGGPPAVAHDHDLVVISSTVGSNNVGNAFSYRSLGGPFISWESGLMAKGYAWMADPNQNGFVVGEAPTARTASLDVTDDAHPITEGFGLGLQDFFYAPQRISASTDPVISTVAPGVKVLARVPAPPFASLAALLAADPESGDLGDGFPAEARQVFFPLEDESFAGVNDAGHLLFHRAFEWALGEEKAALLGPMPEPPGPPPQDTVPSFYINLGGSLAIPAAGFPVATRVLVGDFLEDLSLPGAPALGGDTRVWTPLPSGAMQDFLSVYITVEPEP
ncbi:MAG: hypothetical protein HY721_35105, partial [Planctomycetes bacterium]|nr:hypothetical protein [Planctomycetota bacterium]